MKNAYPVSLFILTMSIGAVLFGQSSRFLIDTTVTYQPARQGQIYPAITYAGTDYFICWSDFRDEIWFPNEDIFHASIYGCRVTSEGTILDSAGIFVSYWKWPAFFFPTELAVTYGDGDMFCVWSDFRDSKMLYGCRIDTHGIVLDPDGFRICTHDSWKFSPSVAFDGNNFLVVWADARTTPGVYGCRIKTDGTILDPEGILIAPTSVQPSVSVCHDGTNYLVVFSDGDIYGVRIDTSFTIIDTTPFPICTAPDSQCTPSVVYDRYYFVVWKDSRSGSNSDIYGARVDTGGIVLDTNGIAISTYSTYEYNPSVSCDGTNYLVTWQVDAAVFCARVDTAGTVLDPGGTIVAQGGSPSVAFDGSNYTITWSTGWSSDGNIYTARIDTAGNVIDTISTLVSISAHTGCASSSAFDGTNYFTVWTDDRDSSQQHVYGSRIDTTGAVLDPAGIPLVNGRNPAVAFDGSNYLAVCSGIRGVRVDTFGTVIDTISIHSGGDYPAITYDNEQYFVVWRYGWADIYGARVDAHGVVLDTNVIIIADDEYYEEYPDVTSNGTDYFAVWQYGNPITPYNIYGARVDTTGVLLDTVSIAIATRPCNQCCPSVAWDGTNYFVVWQDSRNGHADIYGARITPDGTVLDPSSIPICTAPFGQYAPRIAFDGHNYCVVWEDWRNGDYTDVYGCWVTPAGTIIDEFVVSNQPNNQNEPALVKGIDNFLITYAGFVDSIKAHSTNTKRIWGILKMVEGIEERDAGRALPRIRALRITPNPAHSTFSIQFYSVAEDNVTTQLYDVAGRLVSTLFVGIAKIGLNEFLIEPVDVPAGIYFVLLETLGHKKSEKVVLLR